MKTRSYIAMNLHLILMGLIAFLSTLSGGLLAARLSSIRLGALTAFAAGVLIAVPLFDLLPESLNLAAAGPMRPESILHVTALGFVIVYVLERYFSVHRMCEGDVCRNVRHPKGGFLAAAVAFAIARAIG
jgi:zinc transporter ZupT